MNMREHVKIVAYVYIILGVLITVMGIFFISGFNLLGFAINKFADAPDVSGFVLSIVGFFLFILFAALGLPGIMAGYGLLKYKSWARILTIILSVIRLINFPIGTLIGGYSLWVLSHYEIIQLFNEETQRKLQ